ncbi:MAG TPA: hypothetical protein VFE34_11450, partial [Dongiaceae bacterium]|nr:hypothetical protein [Dongiaceae bacterium]
MVASFGWRPRVRLGLHRHHGDGTPPAEMPAGYDLDACELSPTTTHRRRLAPTRIAARGTNRFGG